MALKPGEVTETEQRAIEAALGKLVSAEVKSSHPIADKEGPGRQVYLLYEHVAAAGCEGCPSEEQLALNPGCKKYGLAHAILRDSESEPEVVAMPIEDGSCELRVLQWAFEERGAVLEGVISEVLERGPGKAGKPLAISRRQDLVIWNDPADHTNGIASPSFGLTVAEWQAQPGKSREPPARSSAFLYSVDGRPVVVHLLPCLDPWSDEACDDHVRRRRVIDVR